jgi:hypothetical protein
VEQSVADRGGWGGLGEVAGRVAPPRVVILGARRVRGAVARGREGATDTLSFLFSVRPTGDRYRRRAIFLQI